MLALDGDSTITSLYGALVADFFVDFLDFVDASLLLLVVLPPAVLVAAKSGAIAEE